MPKELIEGSTNEWLVECDNCGETRTYYAPVGSTLSSQLGSDGWTTYCVDRETFYYCKGCEECGSD